MNDFVALCVPYIAMLFIAVSVCLRLFGKTHVLRMAARAVLWFGSLLFVVTVIPGILLSVIGHYPMGTIATGMVFGVLAGITISLFITLIDRTLDRIAARPKTARVAPVDNTAKIKVHGKPIRDNSFAFSVDNLSTAPPKGGWTE